MGISSTHRLCFDMLHFVHSLTFMTYEGKIEIYNEKLERLKYTWFSCREFLVGHSGPLKLSFYETSNEEDTSVSTECPGSNFQFSQTQLCLFLSEM